MGQKLSRFVVVGEREGVLYDGDVHWSSGACAVDVFLVDHVIDDDEVVVFVVFVVFVVGSSAIV